MEEKLILEDDEKEPVGHLIQHRIPWLVLGLLGGVATTFVSSRFEEVISRNINLVFFIPVIVYMADAVGTQTETIFVRKLSGGKANFGIYILKESVTGLALGTLFGLLLGLFAYLWLHSASTAITVGLAMLVNVTIAPMLAVLIPQLLQKERTDPALGSGPFTTILQDLISLLIYFLIASIILFR